MRLSKRYLHAAALAVILGMTLGFAAIPPAANATSEGSSPMDGVYQLVNVGSGKYLDVAAAGTVPGSNVQQYTGNGTVAQEWLVTNLGNGYASITPGTNPGLSLDVSSALDADGANVQVYEGNGSNAQMWTFISNGDGTYRIMPRSSSTRVVDVAGSSMDDAANVELDSFALGSSQRWALLGYDPQPTMGIESPTDRAYTGDVTVKGWALMSAGLARVDIYLDLGTNDRRGYSVDAFDTRVDVHDLTDPFDRYADSYDCGFTQVIPGSDLGAGAHSIDICGIGTDGTTLWVSRGFTVS